MNKIKIYIAFAAALILSSCSMDTENYTDIPTENAYESVQDVQNGVTGAYYALGTYRFYGKNVVAFGDMSGDVSIGSSSSGHFRAISTYILSETASEFEQVWEYGAQVLDRTTRTILGGESVKAKASSLHLSDADIAQVDLAISESYSLRALTSFTMVNLFGLHYNQGADNLGIPLLTDKILQPFEKIQRATVGETYTQVLKDIESAKTYYAKAKDAGISLPNAFFMNEAAIYALEARVLLHMNKLPEAKVAAQKSLTLAGNKAVTNEGYVSMWASLAISDEDIFTISKTADDNLSANSINTLYGSYKGALKSGFVEKFFGKDSKDIRVKLISGDHPMKFDGIPSADAVNNIPVFRKSEMYLIIAEAEAKAGAIAAAQTALFYTAKRDEAITDATALPSTSADLLTFIAKERVREFFQEGHRFYEARRTGELISVAQGNKEPFDASKFVFPIPAAEVNAGFGVVQNPNWFDNLPVDKK